jgi:hypothetical protein
MENKILFIFDIDGTLFDTSARAMIKNRMLNSVRYIDQDHLEQPLQLELFEEMDFAEFRSAEKFANESVPKKNVVQQLQANISKHPTSRTILLTARADLNCKETFLNSLTKQGLDMSRIYVERAGNIGLPTPMAKKSIIKKYLDQSSYTMVKMYDDQNKNLKAFLDLELEYKDTAFKAKLVNKNGAMRTFHG